MSDSVMVLDAIHKSFGRHAESRVSVLSGVTLRVATGEIVGLIAPSGGWKIDLAAYCRSA